MILENFGRKRLNLPSSEITKLVIDQINILSEVAIKAGVKVTHVKPHGALNNMACENYDLAKVISESIIQVDKELNFFSSNRLSNGKGWKKTWNKNCNRNIC